MKNIYVCMESLIENDTLQENIRNLYKNGNNIIIACTEKFRRDKGLEFLLNIMSKIDNQFTHTRTTRLSLSFLKPKYDIIYDNASAMAKTHCPV